MLPPYNELKEYVSATLLVFDHWYAQGVLTHLCRIAGIQPEGLSPCFEGPVAFHDGPGYSHSPYAILRGGDNPNFPNFLYHPGTNLQQIAMDIYRRVVENGEVRVAGAYPSRSSTTLSSSIRERVEGVILNMTHYKDFGEGSEEEQAEVRSKIVDAIMEVIK